MKKQAKLYKEYQDWTKKQNAKGLREYMALVKQDNKDRAKAYEVHKRKLKKWKKDRKRYEHLIEEWELKGKLYRMTNPRPEMPRRFRSYNYPRHITLLSWLIYFPGVVESMQGFYEWLVKHKYKIK